MAPMYFEVVKGIRKFIQDNGVPPLVLSDEHEQVLRQCSIFATNGKATVHTNFKTGVIDGMPHKAGIGRDIKMYKSILHALQCMRAYDNDDPTAKLTDQDLDIIKKCAYSSVNRERRKILEILSKAGVEGLGASDIGTKDGLGLDKEAVLMHLSPLHAVGLIKKVAGGKGTAHNFSIPDPNLRQFILDASALINDKTVNHAAVDEEEIEEATDWGVF